jgi:hypothetical protein
MAPHLDRLVLATAVVLMLAGAVTLVAAWVSAGIAIPAIAVGIALVAIIQLTTHRRA